MWIFNNLLYKVVALLVACVLWSAAQGIRSVEQSLDVPIEIRNLPADLIVVGQSVELINMRISGSRAAIRGAQKDRIRYVVSLDGVKPGRRTFPVSPERFASLRRGARVLAHSPSTVTFQIEPIRKKRVRIRPDVAGPPAEGYRIAGIQVEPREIVIAGAQSAVRRIREIRTERLDVSSLRQDTTQEVLLAPGVDHVWAEGDRGRATSVRVTVRIRQDGVESGMDRSTSKEGMG